MIREHEQEIAANLERAEQSIQAGELLSIEMESFKILGDERTSVKPVHLWRTQHHYWLLVKSF
ncbi:MAG: hypothetical protein KGZ56_05720, partial [Dethiobacter sp.]|nr:hypothetical protein [Dethiobacter sp.]MBS3898581.1 hypothetical protein [Dethiobacter sp.]